jgi:hypothetical protein
VIQGRVTRREVVVPYRSEFALDRVSFEDHGRWWEVALTKRSNRSSVDTL